jgi:signal peptidase II
MRERFDNVRWLWLSAFVIAADHATKFLVEHSLARFEVRPVVPHFNLVNMHNTGVAFSMFNTAPAAIFILLAAAVSIGIFVWLKRHPRDHRLVACAFAFILGGALGNAIDRAARGFVVDFVQFYVGNWSFAAFNVADSAITVGAALLLLDMLLEHRRSQPGPASSADSG